MDKNIGFRRNIYRHWLDATAAFCVETDDAQEIRARLEPIVAQTVQRDDNRRQAIDILINIWLKSLSERRHLRDDALRLFEAADSTDDRLWLHYGLTLLRYDFFREVAAIVGQTSRYGDELMPAEIKQRVFARVGQIGAAGKATERVIFSLRNWGILAEGRRRSVYVARRQSLSTAAPALEAWLLAAGLATQAAEELPFADLLRLPELFPFRFTLGVDDLRCSPRFEVQRQGLGLDMVRLAAG